MESRSARCGFKRDLGPTFVAFVRLGLLSPRLALHMLDMPPRMSPTEFHQTSDASRAACCNYNVLVPAIAVSGTSMAASPVTESWLHGLAASMLRRCAGARREPIPFPGSLHVIPHHSFAEYDAAFGGDVTSLWSRTF